jgi:hypothetical protein
MFEQLGLIGCGLMGGSFALALKRAGLVKRVVGYSKSPSTTERARLMGVIDVEAPSALLAVSGADIVLLAVPVAATEATFKAIRHLVTPTMLIMDVGSTKRDVVDAARRVLREQMGGFVPAHPIAGREVAGVDNADPRSLHRQAGHPDPHRAHAHGAAAAGHRRLEGHRLPRDQHVARVARRRLCRRESPAAPAGVCAHERDHRPAAGQGIPVPRRSWVPAISPALRPASRMSGATSCWPTVRNCWRSRRSFSARSRPSSRPSPAATPMPWKS